MGNELDIITKLKELSGIRTAREVFEQGAEDRARRAAGEFEIGRVVPGEVVRNEAGAFFFTACRYPVTERHGNFSLLDAQQVSGDAIAVVSEDEELSHFRLHRAIFIDTETTGLAGGTGTYAFLVGVGRFEEGEFVLRQYFMRDYDEEEAMLRQLADVFRDAEGVVTYNGKSFDIPLLQTRFITSRIRLDIEDLAHLDLLHVARRLWKMRLGDCSLGNVECEILGIRRHGDIPSHLIPQTYFDYVRSRDARRLDAVFRHNRQDILSLAGVASRAAQLVSAPPELVECEPLDLLSLARLYFRRRKYRRCERYASDAFERGSAPEFAQNALYLLALSIKRQHRWDDAHKIWTRIAQQYRDDITARVEMAKHLEHRQRDLTGARRICEESLEIACSGEERERTVEELRYRLARIERKLNFL